jgi:hypothetical protein
MNNIPKLIHFCWLSGEPYPAKISSCIESWSRIMPDYDIMLWNKEKLNGIQNSFVSEAFEKKKWAFVADFVRLYALYHNGGIYLDSDVKVYQSFDKFLVHSFFSCVEYFKPIEYIAIEAAVMGAKKGHPFIKRCLDLYSDIPFVKEDGSFDQTPITKRIAEQANLHWDFKYKNEFQKLKDDMVIYPAITFTNPSGEFSLNNTYAIHLCNGSWLGEKSTFFTRIARFIHNYYKRPDIALENIYKKIKVKLLG